MEGSVPDLRWQVAGLLAGTIEFKQFEHWFIMNNSAIAHLGSDADVDFLNDVWLLHAELTSDYINVAQFVEALRELNEVGAPADQPGSQASS